ncbi:hypothetical protein FJ872_07380 [Mesorhizobium sp. B2-5-9]|nr:hypothetical protein FJ872_07380 [Mesorhizobium sp. B2-5-9]
MISASRSCASGTGSRAGTGSARKRRLFVIHGRSKERSDAAQTRGSMPRPPSAATVRNLLRCTPRPASRHGSQGFRDAAFAAAPPWDDERGEASAIPKP